jgi:excisionase family DNA binding protein
VAAWLNISTHTVYRLAADGHIPVSKVGGSLRFDRAALERWLAQARKHQGEAV